MTAEFDGFEDIDQGPIRWRFDRAFLQSRWTCIWGRGCHGIEPTRQSALGHGCCSVGAHIDNVDEAMTVAALADTIVDELFEHRDEARRGGIFSDDTRTNTRVVDGACIFLNRPGFAGGAGCALHLAALSHGESPVEWKPSVCWQLPIKIDWTPLDDHVEIATVHRWTRADWGEIGETMAWCCTEGDEAYVGGEPVIDALSVELEELVGTPVFVELRRRLSPG